MGVFFSCIGPFFRGLWECRGDLGMTYDGDAYAPRSVAYDRGRNIGCKLLGLD
jgi:hypothetical protein